MALEDNLDIGIQRYNLSIADTDILRTRSGAAALGVNAGLVQGTPGGTTGTTSAGGTGRPLTGATGDRSRGHAPLALAAPAPVWRGIVASTLGEGPPIDNFDPFMTGTVSGEHATTPETNTVFTGTPTLQQNTTTANFHYTQGFSTGTLMTVGFNNNRISSNSLFNSLVPTLTPNFRFELRQHLLPGFGFDPNLRWIRIARNNREIDGRDLSPADHPDGLADREYLLGPGQRVRERNYSSAPRTSRTRLFPTIRSKCRRDAGSAYRSAVAERRCHCEAEPDCRTSESSTAAITDEERHYPNVADPILAVAPVIPTDTLNINEQYQVRPGRGPDQ